MAGRLQTLSQGDAVSHHKARAKEHSGKASAAMERGDHKTAMHHLGHALQACKQCVKDAAAEEAMEAEGGVETPMQYAGDRPKVSKMGMRERMAAMKAKASGTG